MLAPKFAVPRTRGRTHLEHSNTSTLASAGNHASSNGRHALIRCCFGTSVPTHRTSCSTAIRDQRCSCITLCSSFTGISRPSLSHLRHLATRISNHSPAAAAGAGAGASAAASAALRSLPLSSAASAATVGRDAGQVRSQRAHAKGHTNKALFSNVEAVRMAA
jgi:hypothetical protein